MANPQCRQERQSKHCRHDHYHAARTQPVDQPAHRWQEERAQNIVQRKGKRNRSAARVKLVRERFKEDAKRIHRDRRAKHHPRHTDEDNPPPVEDARPIPLLTNLSPLTAKMAVAYHHGIGQALKSYFSPYTSISPCGLVTVVSWCPVEMYTLPFATTGELNLIPYPGTSAAFSLLL